ncbi:MAG: adenosylcobinamide-GDP ribazoletransferase [Treponema sp.]|nr:adenosylcobinamide-GDP ribazoletransferase [Treponema sp.]
MKAWGRFLSAFTLTSRIPVRFSFTFDPGRMDLYLPLAGIFPALLGGAVWAGGLFFLGGGIVTMLLALAAQYLAFNLFHLDGLMDTADAFWGGNNPEKRLAILKDSRIGVYGFFAGLALLSLKGGLLMELRPLISRYPAAVLAYPISGRISAALVPAFTPPRNETGLGSLLKGARPLWTLAGGIIALSLWSALVYGIRLALHPYPAFRPGPPALLPLLSAIPLSAPAVSLLLARTYQRGIGGYTGDALGAAVELGEALHLGAAFAVWHMPL